MTEATCSILGWDATTTGVPGSVGELNANCRAKIMDLEGKAEMPVGERGEIWVQAPKFVLLHFPPIFSSPYHILAGKLLIKGISIMKGYWHNEGATRQVFVDGPDGRWLKTGDIAFIDSKGHFYIVDRVKELIKVKGNQVAPAELEALLLEHPQISDAAVIGVTIDGSEVPRAYVVLQVDATGKVQEEEIAAWLAKRVSRFKRLVGGVVFAGSIPKNPVSPPPPPLLLLREL
jgi:4-coumarate--CoA ligase